MTRISTSRYGRDRIAASESYREKWRTGQNSRNKGLLYALDKWIIDTGQPNNKSLFGQDVIAEGIIPGGFKTSLFNAHFVFGFFDEVK
uniref:Uncharacterized protein n=1 Tax=Candidatus Kentrum eta TaxID=2126337 RepID=A0A450VEC9_9GAMM|nr:MAG: hypothetical protein BECKH772A_GA0070896_1009610 [Candidatus Kentron sp. H]VFJ97616.1 MAG: hypothetical protein BECKH772B_GA0070898_101152 [Candidatus Kentron sp. H]VFK03172.1 MAG: hypothetical protein BECKH772C_GA0070978_101161 [Candidatus Kentron sp. H]